MKKIIFVIVLLLISFYADARMCGVMLSGAGTVKSGASCAYESGQSCVVATDDTTGASNGQYIGQGDYYPSANMNVCQIDLWPITVNTNGYYTVYIYQMSGTSLGAEVCHSETKQGSAITTGQWNSFAITGDCNIVSGGSTKYGIVITGDADIDLGDKAVSGGCTTQGGLGIWVSGKTIDSNYMDSHDVLFKLYGK